MKIFLSSDNWTFNNAINHLWALTWHSYFRDIPRFLGIPRKFSSCQTLSKILSYLILIIISIRYKKCGAIFAIGMNLGIWFSKKPFRSLTHVTDFSCGLNPWHGFQNREFEWFLPSLKWTCVLKNAKSFVKPSARSFRRCERRTDVWIRPSIRILKMKMISFCLKSGRTGKCWMTTCGRPDSRCWWEPGVF